MDFISSVKKKLDQVRTVLPGDTIFYGSFRRDYL